jgi:hypothetical protein
VLANFHHSQIIMIDRGRPEDRMIPDRDLHAGLPRVIEPEPTRDQ